MGRIRLEKDRMSDFNNYVCVACGSSVSMYRPQADEIDCWYCCDNELCKNHDGEEHSKSVPDWITDPRTYQDETRESIKNQLDHLFPMTSIPDNYSVTYETWEDIYPFMPERLLAIEAEDLYHINYYGELPANIQGYPYKKRWLIYAIYAEDREFYRTSNVEPDFSDEYLYPTAVHSDEKDVTYPIRYAVDVMWELRVPGFLCFFTPVHPIKYISFTYTINKYGDFSLLEDKNASKQFRPE